MLIQQSDNMIYFPMDVYLLTLAAEWYSCLLQNADFSKLILLSQRFMGVFPLTSKGGSKSNTKPFRKLHQQHCGIKCQHYDLVFAKPVYFLGFLETF